MVIVIGFTATLIYGGLQLIDGEIGAVGEYSVLVFNPTIAMPPLTCLGETLIFINERWHQAIESLTFFKHL